MQGGIPERGPSIIPQGRVIAFLLRGACSSQERWLLQERGISWQRNPHSCSPTSLPTASHTRLSLRNSSPHHLLFAWAPGEWLWTQNLCFGPYLKKKNSGFVSRGLCVSPSDKNPATVHYWMLGEWLMLALVLLHAQKPGPGSRPLCSQGSSHSHAAPLACHPREQGCPPFTFPSFLPVSSWFLAVLG